MNIKQWLGQTTTGAGFATVLAGAGAVATGTMGWQQAVPLLVAGAAGLIWPENASLQSVAKQTANDVEALVSAYQAGTRPAAQPPTAAPAAATASK